jgi:ABC-type maltose transport system permease subunit
VAPGRLAPRGRLGGPVLRAVPDPVLVSAAINPLGTLSTSTLIPTGASLENFDKLFANTEYLNWYWNTMVIALVAGALSMFISACAAYAYSRFRFRGRRLGLLGLLLIQMFPQFLAIVTLYLMFTTITDYYQDRLQHPVVADHPLPGRGPRGEHLADEGVPRHHSQGPGRVGPG